MSLLIQHIGYARLQPCWDITGWNDDKYSVVENHMLKFIRCVLFLGQITMYRIYSSQAVVAKNSKTTPSSLCSDICCSDHNSQFILHKWIMKACMTTEKLFISDSLSVNFFLWSPVTSLQFFLFTATNVQGCIQVTTREVKPLVETLAKSQV